MTNEIIPELPLPPKPLETIVETIKEATNEAAKIVNEALPDVKESGNALFKNKLFWAIVLGVGFYIYLQSKKKETPINVETRKTEEKYVEPKFAERPRPLIDDFTSRSNERKPGRLTSPSRTILSV